MAKREPILLLVLLLLLRSSSSSSSSISNSSIARKQEMAKREPMFECLVEGCPKKFKGDFQVSCSVVCCREEVGS